MLVAIVARLVTGFLPSIVAEVSVALLLGIVVATVAGSRLLAVGFAVALIVGLGSLVAIVTLGLGDAIGA